jgi:Fe-S oxidoreductase
VTRVRVRLLRKPKFKRLVIIGFSTFAAALDAGKALLAQEPLAIEVMDEWVQGLANKAGILDKLPEALRARNDQSVAYNFVEFVGDDARVLDDQVNRLRIMTNDLPGAIGSHVAADDVEMAALWSVRAASVGLLGKVSGTRRPIAFVEDCVVPVENLAPFVAGFGALLSQHGLSFGMYGHVDVGCLHIRPALNIDDIADQKIMKAVSDGVFALTNQFGGIFWGEHGKGVRGAYLADFVGEVAFAAFVRIKNAFDPFTRFNPGKLVGSPESLMGIATTPFRPVNIAEDDPLNLAFRCNGNAQCLSYQRTTPMCPSFKATRDIRHSPKGRADALRAWHLARSAGSVTQSMQDDIQQALDGCLGCKACATSCPVQVDIPEMKSHFLDAVYVGKKRPAGDYFALLLEEFSPVLARYRKLLAPGAAFATPVIGRMVGMTDLPILNFRGPKDADYKIASPLDATRNQWPEETVFIWQDAFTALFDTPAQVSVADGLSALGYNPVFVELLPAGKAAHVLGDRQRFSRQAKRLRAAIDTLAAIGRPMIGVDPAFVMMLRQEYSKAGLAGARVLLVQEFLAQAVASGRVWPSMDTTSLPTKLFGHCSETAGSNNATKDWVAVFKAMGASVDVQATGCCGMAGLYGHQNRHQAVSRKIFALSWEAPMSDQSAAMVTGFSCRCQTERLSATKATHPMRWIADAIAAARR